MANPKPNPLPPQYSFTGFQVNNPTAPPPGDRLDGEYARLTKAITDTIAWVSTSLNSDGSLKNVAPPAGPPTATAGAAGEALAQDYAVLAGAWAEYMPGTIPPNILAVMDITGDHWSARWWANQAAQLIQAATPLPPLTPGGGMGFGGSGTIPAGFAGDINIRNTTNAPITITLPSGPVAGQTLKFKDCAGNAGTYPITIVAAGGVTIDGNPNYALMSNFMSLEVFWMGDQWGTR